MRHCAVVLLKNFIMICLKRYGIDRGSDVLMPHDPADFGCPAKRQCCRGAGHHRTM